MSWPLSLTCTFFEPRRGRGQKWLQPPTGPSPGTSPSDPTVSPIGFHPAVVEEAWIWAEAAATTPRRRDTPVQAGPYPASRRRLRWDLSRLRDAPSSRFRSTRIPHPHSLPTPPSPSLPWGAQYLLVVFLLQLLLRLLGIAFRKQFVCGQRRPRAGGGGSHGCEGAPEAKKKRRVQRRRWIEPLFREPELGGLGKSAALWRIDFSSVSSVQSLSRVRLCDPMNRSTPALPVHHQLLEFTQTHVHRVSDASLAFKRQTGT